MRATLLIVKLSRFGAPAATPPASPAPPPEFRLEATVGVVCVGAVVVFGDIIVGETGVDVLGGVVGGVPVAPVIVASPTAAVAASAVVAGAGAGVIRGDDLVVVVDAAALPVVAMPCQTSWYACPSNTTRLQSSQVTDASALLDRASKRPAAHRLPSAAAASAPEPAAAAAAAADVADALVAVVAVAAAAAAATSAQSALASSSEPQKSRLASLPSERMATRPSYKGPSL